MEESSTPYPLVIMSTSKTQAALQKLNALWKREQEAIQQRFIEERRNKSLMQRVAEGYAIHRLHITESDAAAGGRILLWLKTDHKEGFDDLRIGTGDPVLLWWDDPESAEAVQAVVTRRENDRLGVIVEDYPERLEGGDFNLDLAAPKTTFQRGTQAIQAFIKARANERIGILRDICFGDAPARFGSPSPLHFFDAGMNAPQREAVSMAMRAEDIAFLHGPPGTGKTRTLVEIIRQAQGRGERILATAASNTAVDNLAERLADAGLRIVRLGHPARIAEKIEAHSLDRLLDDTEEMTMARRWIREAREIRRRIERRIARGELKRDERIAMKREASDLTHDAKKALRSAQASILQQAAVICCTAAGADSSLLGDLRFDRIILDEATQAVDPIALCALSHAGVVVMAGDPLQLPPTVIDLQAEREGLGETIFSRQYQQSEANAISTLTVQYRMHEQIMAFPSLQLYEGRLEADASCRTHRLEDLGILPDPLRPTPLIFLDTAGKGWQEERAAEDPSLSNPEQAERTAAEARRLLNRGVPHKDIAIITPYYGQARLLRHLLHPEHKAGLEIGTVDGFQGREKEAILVDLVRSNDDGQLGFLTDIRRANVALTRARRFLLVIGDSATLSASAFYNDFLNYAQELGAWRSAWDDDAPLI